MLCGAAHAFGGPHIDGGARRRLTGGAERVRPSPSLVLVRGASEVCLRATSAAAAAQ